MKSSLTGGIQKEIKDIIEIILHEVELKNLREISGVIPLQIAGDKFNHPGDVTRIIRKINEGERHDLIRTFSEYEFFKYFDEYKITKETIAKLKQTRSTTDLVFAFGEQQVEAYFYFLINDINGLKKIKKMLEKGSSKKQNINNKYWLVKKSDKYYFDGNLLDIKNADYFKTFDIVFSFIPKGGKTTYEKIIKVGKTRDLRDIDRRSIQRALTTKASYLYKNTGIIFYVGATPLFEADPKGKFLQFNNKK